ncbi:protein phosphatase 2C domain-containing protein [Bradyrhizobium sediminis]|uniref:Protein phosphatase 2C domain-containing protein n=1 Tax=Bradyrhizobium sediminis TaxID=2840469 RepID=A0A975RMG7_9BRAD|nr:protein phosphatase 2C domain-containing protein [Bradyrhizobium sediminis]QWG12749.1 protein phosphatase 2C domain-containing protein [Bradyrhizobium sediminis]
MRFVVDSLTSAGPRPENQDAIGLKEFGAANLVVAVADGLGGHAGGRIASMLAVETFVDLASERNVDLQSVALHIHSQIREYQQRSPEIRTMATTLSGAIFRSGLMEFVHCGDTRISVARNAGIRRLTVDHTEAQRLLSSGAITKAQFEDYPRKNILESALGIKGEPKIDAGSFPLMLGDRFFFSSDGFHNKIPLRELFVLTSKVRTPQAVIKILSDKMALRNADDNYSIATVFVVG